MNLIMEVGNACRIPENFRSLRLYIRREVIKTVAQPEYRPTVCLNSMTGKVRGMLLYQGAESYEDICVTKKMTRIGYGRCGHTNTGRYD